MTIKGRLELLTQRRGGQETESNENSKKNGEEEGTYIELPEKGNEREAEPRQPHRGEMETTQRSEKDQNGTPSSYDDFEERGLRMPLLSAEFSQANRKEKLWGRGRSHSVKRKEKKRK